MDVAERLLELSALAYLIAVVAFGLHFVRTGRRLDLVGATALAVGFLVHTASIVSRSMELGVFPVTTFYQGLSFFSWLLVGSYLVMQTRLRLPAIGVVVSALACVLTAASSLMYIGSDAVPAALRSPWLPVHVTLAFLGNAIFGLAFAVSVVYLVQERALKSRSRGWVIRRLPALEQLDRLNYRCLGWGFPLLTLGILSGGIWAASTWGQFWSWEPREVLSLITWIIYAALLQFRLTAGLRGRRAATLTIVGFGVLVASYVSINLLPLHGRHGGGFG